MRGRRAVKLQIRILRRKAKRGRRLPGFIPTSCARRQAAIAGIAATLREAQRLQLTRLRIRAANQYRAEDQHGYAKRERGEKQSETSHGWSSSGNASSIVV